MTPPTIKLDHLVVAAATLDTGVAWVRERLGVTVPKGGAHDHMATHNCVGRIGDDIYLEIIAINPDDTPDRTRWFSMDEPSFRARLDREGAFLHHWAVNTSDMAATLSGARHAPGNAMDMSRGNLHWKITVRDDGVLAGDGLIPTVIEWPDIPHPSRNMTNLALKFEVLVLNTKEHDDTRLDLAAVGADHLCSITHSETNTLTAKFTRDGTTVTL